MKHPIETPTLMKPIYGSRYFVWDYYILKALKQKRMLRVNTSEGSMICDPKELLKGERMEKVFLKPEEPMILYGFTYKQYIPKSQEEQRVESDLILREALK